MEKVIYICIDGVVRLPYQNICRIKFNIIINSLSSDITAAGIENCCNIIIIIMCLALVAAARRTVVVVAVLLA